MSRRRMLIGAAIAATALSGAAVAVGAVGRTATITAQGGHAYAINKSASDTSHFVPGTAAIKSGGTLTLRNVGGEDHTFSIVKPAQLPRTKRQLDQCKICQTLGTAHGVDPNNEEAPPKNPDVEVGKAGIDQAGDSHILHGKGPFKFKVSAKAGTTLRYMCAIHPWMQGILRVK